MLETRVVNKAEGGRKIGRTHIAPFHTETRYVNLGGGMSVASLYTWALVDGKQRKVLDYHYALTEDQARTEWKVQTVECPGVTFWTEMGPVPEVPFNVYFGATWNDRARSPGFGY